ncbi:sex-determining region Y protein-like [Panonychus citri]|uniref:sex-determining region Y protein-like n=1 Tax=Panonychus citri TaxID=50023 RepID=UPI00230740D6|nr:sex-determining region Y protein-like [Panonychus citri]
MKELEERRIPRPPNAFMLYGKKNRRQIAQDNPNLTNKQISKILGDNWRKMGADDKEVYHQLANEAHADHMKKYPGYYYSPLEARQRKAERKRKYLQRMTIRRANTDQNENGLPNDSSSPQFISENCNIVPTCSTSNPIDSLTIDDHNSRFGDHCYAFIEPDQPSIHQHHSDLLPLDQSQFQQHPQQQHWMEVSPFYPYLLSLPNDYPISYY